MKIEEIATVKKFNDKKKEDGKDVTKLLAPSKQEPVLVITDDKESKPVQDNPVKVQDPSLCLKRRESIMSDYLPDPEKRKNIVTHNKGITLAEKCIYYILHTGYSISQKNIAIKYAVTPSTVSLYSKEAKKLIKSKEIDMKHFAAAVKFVETSYGTSSYLDSLKKSLRYIENNDKPCEEIPAPVQTPKIMQQPEAPEIRKPYSSPIVKTYNSASVSDVDKYVMFILNFAYSVPVISLVSKFGTSNATTMECIANTQMLYVTNKLNEDCLDQAIKRVKEEYGHKIFLDILRKSIIPMTKIEIPKDSVEEVLKLLKDKGVLAKEVK